MAKAAPVSYEALVRAQRSLVGELPDVDVSCEVAPSHHGSCGRAYHDICPLPE
jgi:hypothetical protein